jgi:hypothetical protein
LVKIHIYTSLSTVRNLEEIYCYKPRSVSKSNMAPSATEIVTPVPEVTAKQPEKHVHGAEDKTPLEAISHGPLIHPGKINV